MQVKRFLKTILPSTFCIELINLLMIFVAIVEWFFCVLISLDLGISNRLHCRVRSRRKLVDIIKVIEHISQDVLAVECKHTQSNTYALISLTASVNAKCPGACPQSSRPKWGVNYTVKKQNQKVQSELYQESDKSFDKLKV